jgi:hypothetical protein
MLAGVKRQVFLLGILWTVVVVVFVVFSGGSVRSIYTTVDGTARESPCAHDPTCGEIGAQWWAPWALWLVGLAVITLAVWMFRQREPKR